MSLHMYRPGKLQVRGVTRNRCCLRVSDSSDIGGRRLTYLEEMRSQRGGGYSVQIPPK